MLVIISIILILLLLLKFFYVIVLLYILYYYFSSPCIMHAYPKYTQLYLLTFARARHKHPSIARRDHAFPNDTHEITETNRRRMSRGKNVSPEELANALAVASRLSATEMRDLHALLIKGGDDVFAKTTKSKKKSTKRKAGGKKKKKKKTNKASIAIVKPRVGGDEKVVYQAWPATSNAASAPAFGQQTPSEDSSTGGSVTVNASKDVQIKMSELGLRSHGASVAVAETFAREAFGESLDEEETKGETEAEETADETDDATQKGGQLVKRRKKRRKKAKKNDKVIIKWDPSTSVKGVYPRGTDTVNGKGSDAVTNWSASFGPMKYKLGKAKAAIQVYRGQINVKDKEKSQLSKRLTTEQNEHDYTRMKLLAQEYLFVKCMEMCKKIELSGKAEKMNMPIGTYNIFHIMYSIARNLTNLFGL